MKKQVIVKDKSGNNITIEATAQDLLKRYHPILQSYANRTISPTNVYGNNPAVVDTEDAYQEFAMILLKLFKTYDIEKQYTFESGLHKSCQRKRGKIQNKYIYQGFYPIYEEVTEAPKFVTERRINSKGVSEQVKKYEIQDTELQLIDCIGGRDNGLMQLPTRYEECSLNATISNEDSASELIDVFSVPEVIASRDKFETFVFNDITQVIDDQVNGDVKDIIKSKLNEFVIDRLNELDRQTDIELELFDKDVLAYQNVLIQKQDSNVNEKVQKYVNRKLNKLNTSSELRLEALDQEVKEMQQKLLSELQDSKTVSAKVNLFKLLTMGFNQTEIEFLGLGALNYTYNEYLYSVGKLEDLTKILESEFVYHIPTGKRFRTNSGAWVINDKREYVQDEHGYYVFEATAPFFYELSGSTVSFFGGAFVCDIEELAPYTYETAIHDLNIEETVEAVTQKYKNVHSQVSKIRKESSDELVEYLATV